MEIKSVEALTPKTQSNIVGNIVLAIFLLCVVSLVLNVIILTFSALNAPLDSWQDWGTLFVLVQAAIFLIGLVFAYGQAKEASRLRHFNVWKSIIDDVSSNEARSLRKKFIYNANKEVGENGKKRSKYERSLRQLAVIYDRVAYYVIKDFVPAEDFWELNGVEFMKIWGKSKQIIKNHQAKYDNPNYCKFFLQLGYDYSKDHTKRAFAEQCRPVTCPTAKKSVRHPMPVPPEINEEKQLEVEKLGKSETNKTN